MSPFSALQQETLLSTLGIEVVEATSVDLLDRISCFVVTATDFRPDFGIKESYRSIDTFCRQRMGQPPEYGDNQLSPPMVSGKR